MSEQSPDDEAAAPDASPPRRLIESGPRANDEAWGVDLLRDAQPTRSSAFRKQRIRAALGQPSIRRAPLALRPVIVAGVLGAAAVASAALGHWPTWIENTHRRLTAAPATEVAAVQTTRARPEPRPEPIGLEAPPVEPAAHEPAAMIVDEARSSSAPAPGTRRHHTARKGLTERKDRAPVAGDPASTTLPSVPARTSESPVARERAPGTSASTRITEDTSAVSEATRALRVERDPARARALAKQYLDRYPGGALAEEALAIVVEAAVAHRDADASALAARYLRLYPSGAFRARAQRAVAGP